MEVVQHCRELRLDRWGIICPRYRATCNDRQPHDLYRRKGRYPVVPLVKPEI